MKLKSFSLSALAAGVIFLAVGLIVPLVKMIGISSDNANVGIIGGADSPTFGFVVFRLMNGWPFCCVLLGVSLILTALFCLAFSKSVKQNCTVKTFIYSLSLSALTALGAVCMLLWGTIVAFNDTEKYPFTYPLSVVGGMLCFLVFAVLAVLYCRERKKRWSAKWLVIDVLAGTVYLPTFFFCFSCLSEIFV